MKSEKQPDFQKEIKVLTKADDEKSLYTGLYMNQIRQTLMEIS